MPSPATSSAAASDLPIAELERRRDGEVLTIAGIVSTLKQLTTKKGDPMVFARLDDLTGSAEVVVFNSVYASSRELLEADRILVVKGRVDHKQEGETKLIAIEVAEFEASPRPADEVRLKVDARRAPAGIVRDLSHVVKDFPGEAKVVLALETSDGLTHARARPRLSRRPGAGLLRRGQGAPRRSRRVVRLTGRAGLNGHATVLLVDDVHRATAYYRDRLGFEVGHYDQNPSHYAYAERDGCHLHFAHFEGATPRPNCREAPPDMFDAYFWVDDVDALYAELAERGAELHGRPELQGYGMYDFRVTDPHGYVLAFGRAGSGRAEPESD